MVLAHTSDQHAWFQESRRFQAMHRFAPPATAVASESACPESDRPFTVPIVTSPVFEAPLRFGSFGGNWIAMSIPYRRRVL